MLVDIVGLIGAFFLLAAWIYETYETYKAGEKVNIRFVMIYLVGQVFLFAYSYMIQSYPFMIISATIFLITLIEIDLLSRKSKRKP